MTKKKDTIKKAIAEFDKKGKTTISMTGNSKDWSKDGEWAAPKSPPVTTEQLSMSLVNLRQGVSDEIVRKIKDTCHTWDRGNSKLFTALDDRLDEVEYNVGTLKFYFNLIWFAFGMLALGLAVVIFS